MKSLKNVENLISDLQDKTNTDMDRRVLRDTLRALERSQQISASPKAGIFRKITKTHIYASLAAVVIIAGALIGIRMFSGPHFSREGHPLAGTPPSGREHPDRELGQTNKVIVEKPASVPAVKKTTETTVTVESVRAEAEKARRKLEGELARIEQMFKAGNVDGLITMLAEGEFESKVKAANYLAKMGAEDAIEPLEKISQEYDGRDNPFARAAEQIKSRVAPEGVPKWTAEVDESSTAIEIPEVDTTIIAAEKVTGPPPMPTKTGLESPDASKLALRELSTPTGLVRSFQAEAREAADGYPIKAGSRLTAEVVPEGLLQNLVLYYSFSSAEDQNTAVDISGNNFHGQVHGAEYKKDEILGAALAFDGQDDYISIPDVYLDGFTIAAWVKTLDSSSMNNRRIFMLYDQGHCYAVEGNVRGGISVGAEKRQTDETTSMQEENDSSIWAAKDTELLGAEDSRPLSAESEWSQSNWAEGAQFSDYDWRLKSDTWTHITVTYDGQTGRIYRNGRLREQGHIPAEGFTGTAYIGGIDKHKGGFWCGMIDEVALFNRALNEEEVAQLYLMTGEMVATGPTLTEGVSGNGYYFDADRDYIDVGAISGLGAEQTKMLWINMEASPLTYQMYLVDEGGKNNWIELFDSEGNGAFGVRTGFDEENYFDGNARIEQGYWYHIAVVSRASGDIEIYINGVSDSSAAGFSAAKKPQAIVIGTDSATQSASFKGIIDEAVIFNRALSDYEIKQIYQNTGRLRGDEQGLVGYWNFDNDEGDVVKDSSPYNNNGKLSDM
jgi:hypothetical protein